MLRTTAAAALLVLVAATGCIGGDGGPASDDAPTTKNRAEVSEVRGGIEGVVTDAAVQPVVAANVTLLEIAAEAQTAADGSFAFSNLVPGVYTVRAEGKGVIAAEEVVEVVAGEVSTVDLVLARRAGLEPYSQAVELVGFVECSIRAGVGFAACGAVNLVAEELGLGGNFTNDRFLFVWPVDPDPWQMSAEIQWDSNQPLGTDLSWIVEPVDIPNENQTWYVDLDGKSPLVGYAGRAKFENVDANMTAICNEEKEPQGSIAPGDPEAYCRPNIVDEGGTLMARIFVDGPFNVTVPDGPRIAIGFAFQQEYHVIVSTFYHAPACPEYSVFGGVDCAQQEAPAAENGTEEPPPDGPRATPKPIAPRPAPADGLASVATTRPA